MAKSRSKAALLKGSHPDVIHENIKSLKAGGMSHAQATHLALKHSKKKKDSIASKVVNHDPLAVYGKS